MANAEVERIAIELVMQLERDAGREPVDVHNRGTPYDISSPPRKIEVKAVSGSARGAPVPVEQRQFQAALDDPENYYLYVVDNISRAPLTPEVRVLHGDSLRTMLDGCKPHITYWPTFRTGLYDQMSKGVGGDA